MDTVAGNITLLKWDYSTSPDPLAGLGGLREEGVYPTSKGMSGEKNGFVPAVKIH